MASRLLLSLAERLFADPTDQASFLSVLSNPPGENLRAILWTGHPNPIWRADHVVPPPVAMQSWPRPEWIDVLREGTRPGQEPPYLEGEFYPLDLSSVWAASPLLGLGPPEAPRVLDVCAAPGGKSIFASLALRPAVLLSNEVIGKRLGILRHNLNRCRIANAFTQRLDPAELGAKMPGAFDVVLVDAPCSGQSLLCKGIENPGCFHPSVVQQNARRQRRILAEAARTLAPGGHLLYTTCTFAPDENERVIAWLLKRSPSLRAREVGHLAPWQSRLAEFPCYRLFPQSGLGAGGFTCLLSETSTGCRGELPTETLAYPTCD
jgi:16S rRNA C967 or C1407 C5-methylase (RsmB/RsmF family)